MARTIDPNDVRARLEQVVAAMKAEGLWAVERPSESAFAEMGAFGARTMAFEQWLRWVFVPSVEERLATGGPWPATSSVAARAAREGDGHPPLAALVPALSGFDALFEPGSALAGGAAVRREEEALADRADQMVAEGKEEEAVAEMERAADSPLSPTAHNWLAWYFSQRRSEPHRAVRHGEQAIALRPAWGVAHLNLAWAREQVGAREAAYRGYLDALACGNAHDEAFAEERLAELSADTASRGEPMPPLLLGSPAHLRLERLERVMVAIVAELAAVPGYAPRSWFAAMGVPVPEGDTPFGWVGSTADDRVFVHAIVLDHGAEASAQVLGRGSRGLVLRSHPIRGGDVRAAAAAVAEWVRGGALADPQALTPLDAAVLTRTALFGALHGRRFRFAGAEQHTADRPALVTVSPRRPPSQLALAFEVRPGGGVVVRGMPVGMGGRPPPPVEAPTYAALREILPRVVEASKAALAAFDEFRERPLSAGTAAKAILAGLVEALQPMGAWGIPVTDDGYPRRWPHGEIKLRRDGVERVLGRIDESADGCRVDLQGIAWVVRAPEELSASLPAVVGRAKYLATGGT